MATQLAIDFGTCHTVAVLRRDGQAPRPVLFDGSPLLPSGVYRDTDGTLAVGRDAQRLSVLGPTRFEPYPKRCVDDGEVLLGPVPTPVVDLFAAVLRRVAQEAAGGAGDLTGRVDQVVLTCPADWASQRRELLRGAARRAGLGEVTLVEEPVAAASYCAGVLRQVVPNGRHLAVFDFGGGTLDVTVLRQEPAGPRVLAVGGLDDLGGVDVDAALVGHLGALIAVRDPALWGRLRDPEGTGAQRDRQAFWAEVRAAKEMLSRAASAPVPVPGREDALHLTREELDRVAGPLVGRAVDETRRVLDRAGVTTDTLAGIFLVGGSSRIPLVATRLHARFGLAPTVPEQPELPVAYGALLAVPEPGRWGVPGPAGRVTGTAAVSPPPVPVQPVGFGQPAPAGQVAPPVGAGHMAQPAPVGHMAPPAGAGKLTPPAAAGRLAPVTVRPAKRRRRSSLVWVAGIAVLGMLSAALVSVSGRLFAAVDGAIKNGGAFSSTGLGGAGAGTASLLTGYPVGLTGTGPVAVTGSSDALYVAIGGSQSTELRALDAGTGKRRWTTTLPAAPSELALRVVGDLVVVDAAKSATNNGQNRRLVVTAANGTLLWQGNWVDRQDVAYLGTDAIVDDGSDSPFRTLRVSLRTGRTVWSHQDPSGDIIEENRVQPALTWPGGTNTGVPAPTGPFREGLAADPGSVVELDGSDATAIVLNAATGGVRARATVPLRPDTSLWTVYDGYLIGAVQDAASPGRGAVAGYPLTSLKRAWLAPYNPGDQVENVHPCGPHLICVAVTARDSSHHTQALATATGKTAWPADLVTDFEPSWAVLDGTLVLGDGSFAEHQLGFVGATVRVLEPGTGHQIREFAESKDFRAGSGHLAVQLSVAESKVRLVNVATGGLSSGIAYASGTSTTLPLAFAQAGSTFAVVAGDRRLFVAKATGLG